MTNHSVDTPSASAGARVVDVDVRDDLRAGREPFHRIMDSVASLGATDALHLRATFEPVPLFRVLEKQGFAHYVLHFAEDDWHVWFYRTPATLEAAIDVRDLEPPEPMTRTLAALETLPEGATLVHVNARVPQFLLPILTERGFAYTLGTDDPDAIVVRIRRASPGAPAA